MNPASSESTLSQDVSVSAGRKSLSVRSANLLFMLAVIILNLMPLIPKPGIPENIHNLFSYIPIVIIAILLCKKEKISLGRAFRFRGARPLTFLMAVIITIAWQPGVQLISYLTSLVFPDIIEQRAPELLTDMIIVNIIGIGVIPGLFEEFLLRGGVFNSYQRTGRLRAAILISALLFGLIHSNASQLFYAAYLGILLAYIFMLSDSIWPGVLAHFLNNGVSVLATGLAGIYGDKTISKIFAPFLYWGFADVKQTLITIVCAVIGLVIIYFCLRVIAKTEGHMDLLQKSMKPAESKEKLFTPTLIIAIVLLVIFTVITTAAFFIQK